MSPLGKSGDDAIYHCNDERFDVHQVIKGYQGHSTTINTTGEFIAGFKEALNRSGISLIEVLAKPTEEKQCHEIRLLNLYIKAKNGQAEALKQWQALTV
jgi:thiamine pyrophosphate-dependent acetolactate synthase large subunit-like protein